MRPRIPRPNSYELRARAAKADALVSYINELTEKLGITKSAMLESVVHWTPLWWAVAASGAKLKHPPSPQTIDAVLAQLARAALVERLAADVEPRLSAERDVRPEEGP